MSKYVVEITSDDDVGQRIDNFLLGRLKGVPRQHIYKILRSGEVRVNSGRVKPTYRLALADKVRIPPVRTREEAPIRAQEGLINRLMAAIIYQDDDYLALNKPPGIAVHGGSSISSGLVEQLRIALDNPRLELVHRLDRDTSGCLLLSKRAAALRLAQAEFRARSVSKIYTAIVHGQWPPRKRVLQERLERFKTSSGERRVRVSHLGQSARTDVEVVATAGSVTRLRIRLHTGRTHQIRVHLNHAGHAIVGDTKYGDSDAQPQIPTGLCLHAQKLELTNLPVPISLSAPEPEHWQTIWNHYAKGA